MFGLLLTILSCAGADGTTSSAVEGAIHAFGSTRESRLQAALSAVPSRDLHLALAAELDSADEPIKILADAPDKVGGLPPNVTVEPLFAGSRAAPLWGTEERAFVDSMSESPPDFILLRRDVVPSVDRGKWVASRLYHDDYRELIQLVAIDDYYLMYRVGVPPAFPPQLAGIVATQVRNILAEGNDPSRVKPLPDAPTETGRKWNLVAVARLDGSQELAIGMCVRTSLNDCVVELANDLEREWRRGAEFSVARKITDVSAELTLEVHRVTERAIVLSHTIDDLAALWEMGIDGGIIIDTKTGRVATWPGSISYTRSFRQPDRFLRHGAREFRLEGIRPWRDPDNRLEKFRSIHYLQRPDGRVIPLFRGVPPVPLQLVDLPALEKSVVDGGHWYMRNLAPNDQPLDYQSGQVTYKAWPSENRYSNEYNLVRHTLATWNLVQAWQMDPTQEQFLEGAESALNWTLTWRKDETLPDGTVITFIEYPGDQDPSVPPVPVQQLPHDHNRKLGSVVVGLMGLIDLARAKEDHQWDELMVTMGNFVLHMQDDSGRFQPYYVPENHPYATERNDIVPGEAALALVMLYEYTGDEKWVEPLPPYFAFYEPWWDERDSRRRSDRAWPAFQYENQDRLDLVQFGPWSVMAANAFNRATGREEGVDFAMKVGHWMIEEYMWSEKTAPWPDYLGGYYKLPGELPAMQAFCYAEGTAAAYQLAIRVRPEEREFFEKATRQSARFALQMQYNDNNVYAFPRGDEVWGGTRYAMNETKVRIDYVHHALSSVYQYVLGAREDDQLPEEVRMSPLRKALLQAQAEAEGSEDSEDSEGSEGTEDSEGSEDSEDSEDSEG